LKRISFQSGDIRILGAEIPDRPRADRGYLLAGGRWRRRIRSAIKKDEWRVNLRGIPRHLASFGHIVDAQANPVEYFAERQSAGADHLCKGLSVSAVRSFFLRRDRAGGCVKSDQHSLIRLRQR